MLENLFSYLVNGHCLGCCMYAEICDLRSKKYSIWLGSIIKSGRLIAFNVSVADRSMAQAGNKWLFFFHRVRWITLARGIVFFCSTPWYVWIQILDTRPRIEKTVMKWWANYGKIVLTDFSALSLNLWKEGPQNLGQHHQYFTHEVPKSHCIGNLIFFKTDKRWQGTYIWNSD